MDTTKDTTQGIRVSDLDNRGILVELSGEFDVRDLEPLRRTLEGVSNSGLPTYVDLSGVTFLDVRCTRELAVRFDVYGRRLVLRNLSWQAEASFRACGFLDRIASCPGEAPCYWTEFQERAERESRRTLALAV